MLTSQRGFPFNIPVLSEGESCRYTSRLLGRRGSGAKWLKVTLLPGGSTKKKSPDSSLERRAVVFQYARTSKRVAPGNRP